MKLRLPVRRGTLRKDAVAGVVLGAESVPDGLAIHPAWGEAAFPGRVIDSS